MQWWKVAYARILPFSRCPMSDVGERRQSSAADVGSRCRPVLAAIVGLCQPVLAAVVILCRKPLSACVSSRCRPVLAAVGGLCQQPLSAWFGSRCRPVLADVIGLRRQPLSAIVGNVSWEVPYTVRKYRLNFQRNLGNLGIKFSHRRKNCQGCLLIKQKHALKRKLNYKIVRNIVEI